MAEHQGGVVGLIRFSSAAAKQWSLPVAKPSAARGMAKSTARRFQPPELGVMRAIRATSEFALAMLFDFSCAGPGTK